MMKLNQGLRAGAALVCALFLCGTTAWGASPAGKGGDYAAYVDVFIGTGGHGHTFPGAALPHGMVQLSPDTRLDEWDACSGYYTADDSILGFSHTHLSGTGCGDLGDFLFAPFQGADAKVLFPAGGGDFKTKFSKQSEKASPGYYEVTLDGGAIKAQLTATLRTGFHKYSFNGSSASKIFVDLTTTVHRRSHPQTTIEVVDDHTITGMKYTDGWAPHRVLYFYARFSQPFTARLYNGTDAVEGKTLSCENSRVVLDFGNATEVMAQVALSPVDREGAKNNLAAELKDWNFEAVKAAAREAWNRELGRIEITTANDMQKRIFYTSLYHTALSPYLYSDVDGRYRTMLCEVEQDKSYTCYHVFSLWDTFRALHPLYTLIDADRNQAYVRTMLRKYKESGLLPKWELGSSETTCMIGNHAVSVIADAMAKGETQFDIPLALEACKSATGNRRDLVSKKVSRGTIYGCLPVGLDYKEKLGYFPCDKSHESVSQGLEFAYNDYLNGRMLASQGHAAEAAHYDSLGHFYRNYYDSSTGLMRPRKSDGSWMEPFDPFATGGEFGYTEGNAWQWTWFAPQDVKGLATLLGGREKALQKLDTFFSLPTNLTGRFLPDVTGLIGQYAHGNEPSHHIIYLYNVLGRPWRTQELADTILNTFYTDKPDGLIGNEDCGQMSAWYVLSSLGLYQICPGVADYTIGRPLFDKAVMHLSSGKTLTIVAQNNSAKNLYVKSVTLNGKPVKDWTIAHKELYKGGVLKFVMTGTRP